MKSPRAIPDDAWRLQIEASDPAASAFVAANAGSGKTFVLAQRVVRLLLDGTDPAKILCLTFTKAAAANMANRVFTTLATWATLSDAELGERIREFDGKAADAVRRQRARRLFAQALETPGGLKVQTIHAFCTHLLHQFPFEAKVAARFTVLEERAEKELLSRLQLAVLLQAAGDPDSAIGRALATAVAAAADQTFSNVLREAIGKRDIIMRLVEEAGGAENATAALARALGIAPEDTADAIEAAMRKASLVADPSFDDIVAVLEGGSANDRTQARRLREAAAATDARWIDAYFSVFFTGKGSPRKHLATKAITDAFPRLAERLANEQARLPSLIERRRAVIVRDRSAALITLADAVIRRYQEEKNRRGLLDYDDLIDKTLALLTNTAAAWVHYKLDLGIDHVLIDEAQDTSPKQWAILTRLMSEFTAGEGARTASRSVFAVGDEKQSIFSFQGADPKSFAEVRRHFERTHRAAELEFRWLQFKLSFRSGANVLGAVDAVFAPQNLAASITDDEAGLPAHVALPDAAPGQVDIWPLIEPEERPQMDGWDAPFDARSETSPPVLLAKRIAQTVKIWIARGERIGSGALLAPGDILVLVRQRGALFEAIIRALKDAGIPVAGADRLILTEHIAVMDLMALADALLLPGDDLALATVLRSPLFGFSEEQLFTLAWRRSGTLRDALSAKTSDPDFASAAAVLDTLAECARTQTPFAFYAHLLGRGWARARMLSRLGPDASDALDEFLALALSYEQQEAPTVQGFVAWMRAAETEIKRDMDVARGEVRVMTVHGAKGLEADTVILADTLTRPTGPRPPQLLTLPHHERRPGAPDALVWPTRKSEDTEALAQARMAALAATEAEYRRLLYVGMTRAGRRLIVCGAAGRQAPPKGCWYDLVTNGLAGDAIAVRADDGEGEVRRWEKFRKAAVVGAPETPSPEPAPTPQPAWLRLDVPDQPAPPKEVSPSSSPLLDARSAPIEHEALRRGRLIHRLLQSLPDVAPERRPEAALRYLAHAAGALGEAAREAIATEVLTLLGDPVFAPLFVPGSRAEVPIVGLLSRSGRKLRVFGQVDRLAVTKERVLIADYKTNRPAPATLAEVPPAIIAQLALYTAVLTELYPGRELRSAVIWTDGPSLMEISSSAMAEALERIAGMAA